MTKTLSPDATRRTVPLSELAWCDEHHDELDSYGADPTWAALELVERITETDRWDRVVREPAAADLRIDFEADPKDPPVHVAIDEAETDADADVLDVETTAIEVQPLCCILSDEARRTMYALAQAAADDSDDA